MLPLIVVSYVNKKILFTAIITDYIKYCVTIKGKDCFMIKKADVFLIVVLIIFAFSFYFLFDFEQGGKAVISVDGEVIGEYDLNKSGEINIIDEYNDKIEVGKHLDLVNIAEIKDGNIFMKEANCSDGLCENQGSIYKTNETIVCLPNKVVIYIIGGADNNIDGISE